MKNITKAITFPQFQSITANDDNGEEEDAVIGDIAEQYMRKSASVSGAVRHLDCGIKMVSFTLGTRKQK